MMFALHLSLAQDESVSRAWAKIGSIAPTDAVAALEELTIPDKFFDSRTTSVYQLEQRIQLVIFICVYDRIEVKLVIVDVLLSDSAGTVGQRG